MTFTDNIENLYSDILETFEREAYLGRTWIFPKIEYIKSFANPEWKEEENRKFWGGFVSKLKNANLHLLIGNDSIGIRWPDNTPPNDKFSNKLAKIREDRRTDEGRTKLMVPLFCDKILEKFKSGEQYFKSYNSIITEVETIIGVECSDNLLDMIIDALTKELESKDIKVEKISIDGEAGLMINSFE